jgi:two-component system chemotaxis response regulator CheB
MSEMLKVLLVDDSPTARHMLSSVIAGAPDMEVVGQAFNGEQAVTMTRELRPDVILMDIVMPRMDGLEATREIMHATPTPIVLISASLDSRETDIAFQALSAGALTVQQKPVGPGNPCHNEESARLVGTLRTMAGVQVIRHWKRDRPITRPVPVTAADAQAPEIAGSTAPEIVAIASSTGGPAALRSIIEKLPGDFPLPLVVVQHIAPDFVPSLAQWLPHITPLKVAIAEDGGIPQPGCLYLAPGGVHLRLTKGPRFLLEADPGNGIHVPSGDVLFESVSAAYRQRAIGVILTGMGADGANGLLAMHRAGAYTIAQDEASSVVFGMPKEAINLGAARRVMPLKEIPQVLIHLASMKGNHNE